MGQTSTKKEIKINDRKIIHNADKPFTPTTTVTWTAANTSSSRVRTTAAATPRPARFVFFHLDEDRPK